MEESTSRQYILEAMMASLKERNMETEVPAPMSVPRPIGMPASMKLRAGAMPEDRLKLDSAQWATQTPFSFIRCISSGPEWTQ